MSILGIDIGTTTITALLLSENRGRLINKVTLKNDSFISGDLHFARLQDPEVILDIVIEAVTKITDGSDVSAIGVPWIIALFLAMCCALRLARFNTMLETKQPPYWTHFFTGLPAPAGAWRWCAGPPYWCGTVSSR